MNRQMILRTVLCSVLAGGMAYGQKHEVGLTMGRLLGATRSAPGGSVELQSGVAFQANYAYRVIAGDDISLHLEMNLLANPQRVAESANQQSTRDVASLYATPGVRVKFFPDAFVSPYVAIGGGLAWYEQSTTVLSGAPNAAPRNTVRGALSYGGGVDFTVRRWLALRGEIRDFYSGSPAYNIATAGGQHNLSLTGGFVLRWGE